MSGISVGSLLALFGLAMFGAHNPAGLVFFIFGAVCFFNGIHDQHHQKQLRDAERLALTPPGGRGGQPALGQGAGGYGQQFDDFGGAPMGYLAEDQARAQAVMDAPALPIIPVSLSMLPGEAACFRGPGLLTDQRMMPRLDGRGYVPWDAQPARDEGEVYVTNRRVVFSGKRETREIGLDEVASVNVGDGVVEIWRRGRPLPTRFGVPFPAELAAYIDRVRRDDPMQLPASHASTLQARPVTSPTGGAPSFITCATCGAANGLSANFCQNCAAPIAPASMPTLNHPDLRDS